MKRTSIKEPHKSIINEEYQRAKRILTPLLKGVNRSFVAIRWNEDLKNSGGTCWHRAKLIDLNPRYRDSDEEKWNEDNFRMTVRHEICHLIESNHGPKFKSLLKQLKGHRFVGAPVYEGTGNSNK